MAPGAGVLDFTQPPEMGVMNQTKKETNTQCVGFFFFDRPGIVPVSRRQKSLMTTPIRWLLKGIVTLALALNLKRKPIRDSVNASRSPLTESSYLVADPYKQ